MIKPALQTAERTGTVPESLRLMPEIPDVSIRYYGAFKTLNRSRPWLVGMGGATPSSLQLRDVIDYIVQVEGITELAERRRWIRLIYTMDDEWLAHEQKKRDTGAGKDHPRSMQEQLNSIPMG